MTQIKMFPPVQPTPRIYALLINENGLWAGGDGGVVFWNGRKWHSCISGLMLSRVIALAHTGEWLIAGGSEGIARSRDGGQSWQRGTLPIATAINTIIVLKSDVSDPILFAASYAHGIFKSEDSGATWTEANFGLSTLEAVSLMEFRSALYVACTDGIYRSPNQGRAWKQVDENTEVDSLKMIDGRLAAVSGDTVLAITSDGLWWESSDTDDLVETGVSAHSGNLHARIDDEHLLISDDDGITWERRLPMAPLHDLNRLLIVGDRVMVGGRLSGIYACDLSVGDWRETEMQLGKRSYFGRFGSSIFAASPGGLFRSGDGGASWLKLRDGTGGDLSHLSFMPNGIGYGSMADASALVRTPDGGITWQETPSPFGVLPVITLQAAEKVIFAAVFDARRQMIILWRSLDGGQRWLPGAEIPSQYPLAASWGDPVMIALPGVVLVSGNDPTAAWSRAEFDMPDVMIRAFAGDQNRLYALSLVHGIFVSEDRGLHWHKMVLDLPEHELMDIDAQAGRLCVLMVGGRVAVIESERGN